MLAQATLERYLQQVQQLSEGVAAGDKQPSDLQNLIDLELTEAGDDCARRALLLGERAFYQRQYKVALKHYTEAKGMPLFQFFCYRACAFLFDQEKKTEKAIEFANKALSVIPQDWTTVALYSALLAKSQHHEEAQAIPSACDEPTTNQDEPAQASVTLGAEEFDELTQLFEEHAEEAELHAEAEEEKEETAEPIEPTETAPPVEAFEIPALPTPQTSFPSFKEEPAPSLREDSSGLEQRIHAFQERQRRALKDYLTQSAQKVSHQDYLFHVLEGWSDELSATSEQNPLPALLSQGPRRTTGGYFLRWRGKGVAINPGRNFLQALHRQGCHIGDVDFVVVTKGCAEGYTDVMPLYDLNAQANAAQEQVHIIHYYLHQSAYQALARTLKPHCKQERNSIHSLDLFMDSPDLETVALTDGIQLNYFPIGQSLGGGPREDKYPSSLGMRLDLTGPAHSHEQQPTTAVHPIRVGYASGTPWSPSLAEHFIGCDLLVVGIEETGPEDFRRTRYNTRSLGYFGCLSLLEEVTPRLVLCSEFCGAEGDIRVELVRKLREDYHPHQTRRTTILPGDAGLSIDLTTLQVRCATTRSFVDPSQVHVVRTNDQFGPLRYLAPQSLI